MPWSSTFSRSWVCPDDRVGIRRDRRVRHRRGLPRDARLRSGARPGRACPGRRPFREAGCAPMTVLAFVETDESGIDEVSRETLAFVRALGQDVHALVVDLFEKLGVPR